MQLVALERVAQWGDGFLGGAKRLADTWLCAYDATQFANVSRRSPLSRVRIIVLRYYPNDCTFELLKKKGTEGLSFDQCSVRTNLGMRT